MFVHQDEIVRPPDNHLFDEGISYCRKGRFDRAYQCFKEHLSMNSFCQETIQMLSYCRYKFSENCRKNVNDLSAVDEPSNFFQSFTKGSKNVTEASRISSSKSFSNSKASVSKKKQSKVEFSNHDSSYLKTPKNSEIRNEGKQKPSLRQPQAFHKKFQSLQSSNSDLKLNVCSSKNSDFSNNREKHHWNSKALLKQLMNRQLRIELFLQDIEKSLSILEMKVNHLLATEQQVKSKIACVLWLISQNNQFLNILRTSGSMPVNLQISSVQRNERLNCNLSYISNIAFESATENTLYKESHETSECWPNHEDRIKLNSALAETIPKESPETFTHWSSSEDDMGRDSVAPETPSIERNATSAEQPPEEISRLESIIHYGNIIEPKSVSSETLSNESIETMYYRSSSRDDMGLDPVASETPSEGNDAALRHQTSKEKSSQESVVQTKLKDRIETSKKYPSCRKRDGLTTATERSFSELIHYSCNSENRESESCLSTKVTLDSLCCDRNNEDKNNEDIVFSSSETTDGPAHSFPSCETNKSKGFVSVKFSCSQFDPRNRTKMDFLSETPLLKLNFSVKRKFDFGETHVYRLPRNKMQRIAQLNERIVKRKLNKEKEPFESKRQRLILPYRNLTTLNGKVIGMVKEPQSLLSSFILMDFKDVNLKCGRIAIKKPPRRFRVAEMHKQMSMKSMKSHKLGNWTSLEIDGQLQQHTGFGINGHSSTLVVSPLHCNAIVPYNFNRKEVRSSLTNSNSACLLNNCLNLFVEQICSVIKDSLSLIPADYIPANLRFDSVSDSIGVTHEIKYLTVPKSSSCFMRDGVICLLTRGHFIEFPKMHVYQVDPFWFAQSLRRKNALAAPGDSQCIDLPRSHKTFPFVYPVEILLHSLCTDLYNYTLITGPFRIRFVNFTSYFTGNSSSSNCDSRNFST